MGLMKKYGLVFPIRKINPVKAMIKANQSNKTYPNSVARCFNQGMPKKSTINRYYLFNIWKW